MQVFFDLTPESSKTVFFAYFKDLTQKSTPSRIFKSWLQKKYEFAAETFGPKAPSRIFCLVVSDMLRKNDLIKIRSWPHMIDDHPLKGNPL